MKRHLYHYEYAQARFAAVSALLRDEPARILRPATDAAVAQAERLRTELVADVAGFELGREVTIELGDFEPVERLRHRLPLSWLSTDDPARFPRMNGQLEVAAVSVHPPLTQVAFVGSYRPPMGPLGAAGDVMFGRRVAEAAVHRFVHQIVIRIEELAAGPVPA